MFCSRHVRSRSDLEPAERWELYEFKCFFMRKEGDVFVGRIDVPCENQNALRREQLTTVTKIPLESSLYDEAMFGTAYQFTPLNCFLRRPRLFIYFAKTSAIADDFVSEARVLVALDKNPHPNVVSRIGCVLRENYVIGIAIPRYRITLSEAVINQVAFDRLLAFRQLRSAVAHLHNIGYCHNDTDLNNFVVSQTVMVVLIDLEFARGEGTVISEIDIISSREEDYRAVCHVAK